MYYEHAGKSTPIGMNLSFSLNAQTANEKRRDMCWPLPNSLRLSGNTSNSCHITSFAMATSLGTFQLLSIGLTYTWGWAVYVANTQSEDMINLCACVFVLSPTLS